jgi:hypothetical protein
MFGHHGGGHFRILCRSREAVQFHNLDEDRHAGKPVHDSALQVLKEPTIRAFFV